MQAKISAFFKPSARGTQDPAPISDQIEAVELSCKKAVEISVTYKRRDPKPNPPSSDDDEVQLDDRDTERMNERLANPSVGKTLNKKRSYAQYHLELGQSDFLLHACSVCGMMYARGDPGDEKVHKTFHQNYYQGIQFKGWRVERVVSTSYRNGERIVLVLDGDPPAQKRKVQQVVKVMERELGFSDGQLLHKLCKAYLFISSHRIVGSLIAEPIRTAQKVISASNSCSTFDGNSTSRDSVSNESEVGDAETRRRNPTSLQFGNIKFEREFIRECSSSSTREVEGWDSGSIFCEEEALPARCGIRAIWVVPSHRRKQVASRLLNAVRESFCKGHVLALSECAISPPTSAGKAFFSSYSNSKSFLVYRTSEILY